MAARLPIPAHGHSGMTPAERAIMDLYDAGNGPPAIARRLGRKLDAVRRVIAMYAGDEQKQHNAAICAGSAALLAALQQAAA